MENKDSIEIYRGVPKLIFKGIGTKKGSTPFDIYESDILLNIMVQEYSKYNMIILKTNVEDKIISNIEYAEELTLQEYAFNPNMEQIKSSKTYGNMRLLLKLRESSSDFNKSDFYYIFANAEISANALKKELNWFLDRETRINASKNRSVDLDFETKSSLKKLNGNLESFKNIIGMSLDNLAKEINNIK